MLELANNRKNYDTVSSKNWIRCPKCGKICSKLEISKIKKCPSCDYYFQMSVEERLDLLLDPNTFSELESSMKTDNIVNFPGYSDTVNKLKQDNPNNEAIYVGTGLINKIPVAIGVMNSAFIMGTLNRVVGERIIQLIRVSKEKKIPLIIVTVSGGARMQEGIYSLLQMARIQNELNELATNSIPYISLLTDPTMGGVTASFATTADIILGEKGAMIGFAGPRVIQNISHAPLPPDFQTSETMLENGFIDRVVTRENEKKMFTKLLQHLKVVYQ